MRDHVRAAEEKTLLMPDSVTRGRSSGEHAAAAAAAAEQAQRDSAAAAAELREWHGREESWDADENVVVKLEGRFMES